MPATNPLDNPLPAKRALNNTVDIGRTPSDWEDVFFGGAGATPGMTGYFLNNNGKQTGLEVTVTLLATGSDLKALCAAAVYTIPNDAAGFRVTNVTGNPVYWNLTALFTSAMHGLVPANPTANSEKIDVGGSASFGRA